MQGNDSVTKIAAESGFLTRSNFYREFQRVYDQSPTEYRKTHRRTDPDRSGKSSADEDLDA